MSYTPIDCPSNCPSHASVRSSPSPGRARLAVLLALAAFMLVTVAAPARARADEQPGYLYRVTLMRATPGSLTDLIELYKDSAAVFERRGDRPPLLMRHTQGDHWDLMLLFPMGSHEAYHSRARVEKRRRANAAHAAMAAKLEQYVAWQEDLYAFGPPLATVETAFAEHGFYHVEIFKALPGKRAALYQQRVMENRFLEDIGRPQNLIFERESGAEWDVFTIGFYRDIKDFAAIADVPAERQEAAARKAGFEAANRIGTYLRTLMAYHHDTLAVRVR